MQNIAAMALLCRFTSLPPSVWGDSSYKGSCRGQCTENSKTWANKRDGGHRPMAAATGAVEITLPVAIVAAAYIIGQAMVDASGD